MNANPWKDSLYRLIDEYGGLAIPKGEREEWREVIPIGLRRKYREARQPDAFVRACVEDGRCQAFGIRDTRDLHDVLTARLPHLRMGAGLRLATEEDVDGDEKKSKGFQRLRELSTVVGAEVPRGRSHRVTVYETSPVLWERSEASRSRRAGVAVNPNRPHPPTRIPAKVEQDPDPLKRFRKPEPKEEIQMLDPNTRMETYDLEGRELGQMTLKEAKLVGRSKIDKDTNTITIMVDDGWEAMRRLTKRIERQQRNPLARQETKERASLFFATRAAAQKYARSRGWNTRPQYVPFQVARRRV